MARIPDATAEAMALTQRLSDMVAELPYDQALSLLEMVASGASGMRRLLETMGSERHERQRSMWFGSESVVVAANDNEPPEPPDAG